MFLEGDWDHGHMAYRNISCRTSLHERGTSLNKKADPVLAAVGDLPLLEGPGG
jgi:hypothetical protein